MNKKLKKRWNNDEEIDWNKAFFHIREVCGLDNEVPICREKLVSHIASQGYDEYRADMYVAYSDRVSVADLEAGLVGLEDVGVEDDVHDVQEEKSPPESLVVNPNGTYPYSLRESSKRWIVWEYLDDRKVPRNPRWGSDKENPSQYSKCGAKDSRGWMDFTHAAFWADQHDNAGIGFYLFEPGRTDWADGKYEKPDLSNETHVGLVDFDKCVDPETGDVNPKAKEILSYLKLTFCEKSPSGTGYHALGEFRLPFPEDDSWNEVQIDISCEGWEGSEIELFEGRRYTTVTGKHIEDSNTEIQNIQHVVDGILLKYAEDVNEKCPHEKEYLESKRDKKIEKRTSIKKDVDVDVDTTHDIEVLIAAVDRLNYKDLDLESKREKTEGSIESWDPGYRTSSTGESLKRDNSDGKWWDMRKSRKNGFSLMQLYACEKKIISEPWGNLQGDDWMEAVNLAREEGAPIPKLKTYEELTNGERSEQWLKRAKRGDVWLTDEGKVPYKIILYLAVQRKLINTIPTGDETIPANVYNWILKVLEKEYGIDHGREMV